jgi:hypothetical protein
MDFIIQIVIIQIAKYRLNLTWECPTCNSVNKHFYPCNRTKKTKSINEDMAGTLKECIKCSSEYILGNREWR